MIEKTTNNEVVDPLFAGGGEMGRRMAEFDWSNTPLGPVGDWPQSLKTVVRILLTSRFAMWMAWGPELTFFYNDAYAPTLGVKRDRALGSAARAVWAEIWPDIGPRIEHVLGMGEATWDEALMLFLERSGYTEETYHTFSYSPLSGDDGSICGMLCVVTEVTERIIDERRLSLLREVAASLAAARTQEDIFHAIAESLMRDDSDIPFSLTYLFTPDGKTANLACATGIEPDHSAGPSFIDCTSYEGPWPVQELLADADQVSVENLIEHFPDLPGGRWDISPSNALVVRITQPGHSQPAGFIVTGLNPYRRLDSAYLGFVGLLAGQISSSLANARSHQAERERAEALAELDRAKTAFFNNVSHEFRTPLTLMIGPIEDGLTASSPGLEKDNLEVVHRNCLRLLKLVNTLLDFSRIEAGRMQAVYRPTDLCAYTSELASVFRSAVEKAGLKLSVSCGPIDEPVYVDHDMWEKIVLNLVSNAFKFTEQGEIEVSLKQTDQAVELKVRDTGVGISDEQLPHVFERFHRIEGTRARTHEGTGIGLALVRELARQHSGDVQVESRLGSGSTFIVTIPLGSSHLPQDKLGSSIDVTSNSSINVGVLPYIEEAGQWLSKTQERQPLAPEDRQADSPSLALDTTLLKAKNAPRVVMADDNADMREYVRRLLSTRYDVQAVGDGEAALHDMKRVRPDIVISDVMMPKMDGFELLREIRSDAELSTVPVLFLSARAGEEARIEGMEAGADDYLVKPFSARELLARVEAHLNMARLREDAKRREAALSAEKREVEARFENMADSAPVFIWVTNAKRENIWFNQPWLEFRGRELKDELGFGWSEGIHPDDVTDASAIYEEAFANRQPFDTETRVRRYDGEWRWLLSHGVPRFSSDGTFHGYIGSCIDITSRRQAEEERANHLTEIQSLNTRLQRSMSETHHRIKNNLQVLTALINLQTLQHDETVPVREMERLSQHIRALAAIHDLLTLQSRDEGEADYVSAQEAMKKLLDVLKTTIAPRQIVSNVDDARLPVRIGTSLAVLVNEMISNALKHGQGKIEVTFTVTSGTANLSVSDDGPGFPDGFNAGKAANMGLELITSLAQWDLQGAVRYQNTTAGGAQVLVEFPLTQ